MQPVVFDFQKNFFQLFGLPECYRLDGAQLEQQYHALQAQVHPDKFAHLSETERRLSVQWATRVNEACQTLRHPINRARYILSLHGVDTQEDTNTAMPADFLLEQMEWREAVEEAQQARDAVALDQMESRLRHEMRTLENRLAVEIDVEHEYATAAGDVRKLRFLEKLTEEIDSAFDTLENQ